MAHVRELIIDIVNAGLELNYLGAVFVYLDEAGNQIRIDMRPMLDASNPFKLGNSARFSICWDDPPITLPMANRPLSETQIEITHGPLVAKAIPATEFEELFRAFAVADPALPPRPREGGRLPSRSWLDYRNYSR